MGRLYKYNNINGNIPSLAISMINVDPNGADLLL